MRLPERRGSKRKGSTSEERRHVRDRHGSLALARACSASTSTACEGIVVAILVDVAIVGAIVVAALHAGVIAVVLLLRGHHGVRSRGHRGLRYCRRVWGRRRYLGGRRCRGSAKGRRHTPVVGSATCGQLLARSMLLLLLLVLMLLAVVRCMMLMLLHHCGPLKLNMLMVSPSHSSPSALSSLFGPCRLARLERGAYRAVLCCAGAVCLRATDPVRRAVRDEPSEEAL